MRSRKEAQRRMTERAHRKQGTYSCSKKIVKCTIFFNSVQNFLIVYTIWMYRLVVKSANKDNNAAFLKYLNLAFIGLQGKYTSSHISCKK